MSRRPAAKASAWRFSFSLGELREREVGRAAITCSIFTLDPPTANALSPTHEQFRIRRIQGPSLCATRKCIPTNFFRPNGTPLAFLTFQAALRLRGEAWPL